jgi:hypothetical protein
LVNQATCDPDLLSEFSHAHPEAFSCSAEFFPECAPGRVLDLSALFHALDVGFIGLRQRVIHYWRGMLNTFIDKSRVFSLSLTIMKTKEQLEYENEDIRQSLEVALEELREWKKLQMWGDTPEQVHDFIRARIIKGQNRLRKVATQRDKYKKQVDALAA